MNKKTFKRIQMLHKEGMAIKGAIVVLIDLCKSSDEAAEKIEEMVRFQPGADYDRGFVDAIRIDGTLEDLADRKEHRNYDPPT